MNAPLPASAVSHGKDVSLDDKYTLEEGRVYLSGTQALVRLPMLQKARDRAAGLNTAGFISGYRGSPLGAYDQALWQAKGHLKAHDIVFQPGVNEDLAAAPESLNQDAYAAWLVRLRPDNPADVDALLDATGYQAAADEH